MLNLKKRAHSEAGGSGEVKKRTQLWCHCRWFPAPHRQRARLRPTDRCNIRSHRLLHPPPIGIVEIAGAGAIWLGGADQLICRIVGVLRHPGGRRDLRQIATPIVGILGRARAGQVIQVVVGDGLPAKGGVGAVAHRVINEGFEGAIRPGLLHLLVIGVISEADGMPLASEIVSRLLFGS